MSRRDDVSKCYKKTNVVGIIINALFYLNLFLSLLILIFDKLTIYILPVLIVCSLLTPLLSLLDDCWLWYEAEATRRASCIENAFGIDITNLNVEGYYNNEQQPSLKKYELNTFENIFFSKSISEKMLIPAGIKSTIIFIVFILICIKMKNENIILLIAQTAFSANYICGFVSLWVYRIRLNNLFEMFYKTFVTVGIKGKNTNILLLNYIVEYEAIKAHYKIRLSSKIFEKNNEYLTNEWKEIEKKCKIN